MDESGKDAKEDARFEMKKSCLAVARLIKRFRCLETQTYVISIGSTPASHHILGEL